MGKYAIFHFLNLITFLLGLILRDYGSMLISILIAIYLNSIR